MHLVKSVYSVFACVYLLGWGMGERDCMMEKDQARTSLINVSDGLWHQAAVRRLSVSCSTSQAAQ